MLKKRLITALIGIPLIVLPIWFGQLWFTVIVAVWGVLAGYEFYKMAASAKAQPITFIGLIGILLFVVSPHINHEGTLPLLLTSIVVIPLIILLLRHKEERNFGSWVWTISGILYIGWMLSHFVALRNLDGGRNWIFLAFLVTFAYDSSAFFVGRTWGRHYMVPSISPKKTWEGALGGVSGAIFVSLLFLIPTPLQLPITFWQAILLGVMISVFAQVGDLVESLLKRSTGMKESGTLLPGHGGFLDRIDSIVFAGIVVYYYVIWVIV
ncbi:phosphatidate cytidylyltransferase [Chloroflexota bacterium]